MQNMTNDILNEEFEVWMCGVEGYKGPCPPEGCDRGKCVREQAAIAPAYTSHVSLCQKCGDPTNHEMAQVGDEIWCHPCADTASALSPADGGHAA